MPAEIQGLIDKQDSFEKVRDQISAILAIEEAQQRVFAAAAAEDPEQWRLNVYLERTNPWEQFINAPEAGGGPANQFAPLVSVWFENSSFPRNAGNTHEWQTCDAAFNIDIYGIGIAETDGATGHRPSDLTAALNAQRGLRLVRNILMSGYYVDLKLPGVVGTRWIDSVQSFQPQFEQRPTQHVIAIRAVLAVKMNEYAPQYEGVTLETLIATVEREDSGYVYFNAEYKAS